MILGDCEPLTKVKNVGNIWQFIFTIVIHLTYTVKFFCLTAFGITITILFIYIYISHPSGKLGLTAKVNTAVSENNFTQN